MPLVSKCHSLQQKNTLTSPEPTGKSSTPQPRQRYRLQACFQVLFRSKIATNSHLTIFLKHHSQTVLLKHLFIQIQSFNILFHARHTVQTVQTAKTLHQYQGQRGKKSPRGASFSPISDIADINAGKHGRAQQLTTTA